LASSPAHAADVLVAVAANFIGPMQRIADDFQKATGHKLTLAAGPTGRFHAQIALGGARYQVLLAADDETPRRLVAEGHAVAGTSFSYAIGELVLWSLHPDLVDDQGAVLAAPARFRKLAIANPKIAPYGRAALQVLRARGVEAALRPRLVTGESIAQAYQFVASGNADLGFVALSQLRVPGRPPAGSTWRVPGDLHDEIRQDAVLLQAGEGHRPAQALLDYLRTPAARAVMQVYGYRS
jgi:molybdate transport system substrate-binding protein